MIFAVLLASSVHPTGLSPLNIFLSIPLCSSQAPGDAPQLLSVAAIGGHAFGKVLSGVCS